MALYKQSSAAKPIMIFMTSSTDHLTGLVSATLTVTISKNGAAFAAPAGAVTEVGGAGNGAGWYQIAGNATDTNTLGTLLIHATATGADATDILSNEVVAFDPSTSYSVLADITAIPAAVLDLANGIETSMTLRQAMRALVAMGAGKSTETAGTLVFKRQDGTTTAFTIVHDTGGNRTGSTIGSL